jgi:hypothetical protein
MKAAETSEYMAYIQGGESNITNGTWGSIVLTIKDIVPYFHIPNGVKSYLVPIKLLSLCTPTP